VGTSTTWSYGPRHQYEFFRPGQGPYSAQGTALIHGKLTDVYVTYYDRTWSLSPAPLPVKKCSEIDAMQFAGPSLPAGSWQDFIKASLSCGGAAVTGHVWIGGVKTTEISGRPVTVRVPASSAHPTAWVRARVRWTLFVNPATYVPVQMFGSTTVIGKSGRLLSAGVTDIHLLRPTAANIAKTLVTIPAGFHRVSPGANR
jgi:hypothetical protein